MSNQNSGYELFTDFIASCVFIHDDWDDDLGEVDWGQYDVNPFLLGAKVCVINSLQGFGEQYIDYLRAIDAFPEHIFIPQRISNSLALNLLQDQNTVLHLKEIVNKKHLDISTFYTDKIKMFNKISDVLKAFNHIPKIYPPQTAFLHANRKDIIIQSLEKAGVPVPEYAVCQHLDDIIRFYRRPKRSYPGILIKQSHRKILSLATEKEIMEIENFLEFPVLAETRYEVKYSPICHFLVWRGRREHLFTINQIVDQYYHTGNETISELAPGILAKVTKFTNSVVEQISDFTGVLGVDYIVTPDEEVMAVDVNPRFCSSTYPFYFLQKMGIPLDRIYARQRVIRRQVKDLSVIFSNPAFIPLTEAHGKGLFLFCPVIDFNTGFLRRFSYLAIAENLQELQYFEKIMESIINSL